MTVTTNEFGQQNIFAKEPEIVLQEYNRKGLESPVNSRLQWSLGNDRSSLVSSPTQLVNSSLRSSDD